MVTEGAEGRTRCVSTQLASLLLSFLSLGLIEMTLACSTAPSAAVVDSRPAASPVPSQTPAQTYAEWATRELASMEEGVSAADWMRSHPGEEVTAYEHRHDSVDLDDYWGVRFTKRERLPAGREIIRHAYFYPPPIPSPPALPANVEAKELLMSETRLGLVWLESFEPDIKKGESLAVSARQAISERFGAGDDKPRVGYYNSAYWIETSRWRVGRTTIVSTYNRGLAEYNVDKRRAMTFAYLPNSSVDTEANKESKGAGEIDNLFEQRRTRMEKMMAVAALGSDRSVPVLAALRQADEWGNPPNEQASQPLQASVLVGALKQWLDAAKSLEAPRRAAAYFVADYALEQSAYAFGLGDPRKNRKERGQLKAMGASFTPAPAPEEGDSHSYLNDWMKQAARLNGAGESGELAHVDLLERGILAYEKPDDFSDDFRPIIKEGETYLSRAKVATLKAAAHLVVANAYSDIVALADGLGRDSSEADNYRKEAPQARQKAIENYRAAFLIDNTTPQARIAWPQAWRLIAGLPPLRTTYYTGNEGH